MSQITQSIKKLFDHQNLSSELARATMSEIMQGQATQAQIGAFLAALRMKGETVDEITGCATAMLEGGVPVRPQLNGMSLLDTSSTGGDGTNKFNISTTAAFIAAGCGAKLAKHGNRSNKRTGSADVLEALGVNLQLNAEQAMECIEAVGFAFLFAPLYNPAMKHAIGPRREIKERTVFNFLGPITNPARPTSQLIGIFAAGQTEKMAHVLQRLGRHSAMVVHGHAENGMGLDELTTLGVNRISHLKEGQITTFELDATEVGLPRARLRDLEGGSADENAAIVRGILSGDIVGPKRDVALLNAAAVLSVDNGDIEAGLHAAQESVDGGVALHVLNQYIQKTASFIE